MMATERTVLVTGATGAVGPCVVQTLHEAGYRVRVFARRAPQPELFPPGIEVCVGDITDLSALQTAMQGVGSVLHLAALLHIVNPEPALRERYEQVNVGGTAAVVKAAIPAGLTRVVLLSTIAIYGYGSYTGHVVTEDSPPRPDTFYAHTKLAAEYLVLQAQRSDGHPLGTVLRLGAVYGSRIKGNYQRLVHSLARRRFIAIGPGQNRRTLLYEQDVARAALLALEHPLAGGQVYNVSDGQYHTLSEIIAAICDALGRPLPRFSLPAGLVRFAAGVVEDTARLMHYEAPIGRATVDKYTEDVTVSSQRIQTQLGFVPRFALATGWRETILAMRQRGEL